MNNNTQHDLDDMILSLGASIEELCITNNSYKRLYEYLSMPQNETLIECIQKKEYWDTLPPHIKYDMSQSIAQCIDFSSIAGLPDIINDLYRSAKSSSYILAYEAAEETKNQEILKLKERIRELEDQLR